MADPVPTTPAESDDEPVPLSYMLLTLQRELSRVQDESLIAVKGTARALIREDVSFKIQFKFTPVAADDTNIDSILVHAGGAHEMTLEGKISPGVELE